MGVRITISIAAVNGVARSLVKEVVQVSTFLIGPFQGLASLIIEEQFKSLLISEQILVNFSSEDL